MIRVLFTLLILSTPVWAVEPSEMLADPVLEARAQALDKEIRCVKCQSEAIASSNADWARDARIKVRALIADGATDAEVKTFFLETYGEYALFRPALTPLNWVLFILGPLMALMGAVLAWRYVRGQSTAPATPAPLSAEEETRLKALTNPTPTDR